MQQMLLRSLGLGGIVLSFGYLGRFISRSMGLSGWQWWALQIGFVVLGAIMAWIVYLFIKGRQKSKPVETTPSTEDLAATWNEAKERLSASQRIEDGRIGRMPLMLVVGPTDGAKTTSVIRSGLEPELLSGAAVEGDTAIPTRGINTWYGGGWLFVEAASDVFDDDERWDWTARSLRPDRLAAALSGARQAPRAVLLCYPCSRLGEAGGQVRTEAQAIRTKLSTLAETLGINLPVYLLLTKLDQVSNFTDFTRGLTTDEANEVLGATLRRGGGLSTEAYATAETKQVTAAFDSMVRTLALRRTDLLQRESGEDVRAGAYEFPRELSKLRNALADFIVELGRPTQFGVGPFVRGFYFTGVRPIVVDASPGYAQPSTPAAPVASGATMVFNPNAPIPAAAPARSSGSRRVPQWVFLPRLIRGLIFEDRAALAVTESGVRVSGLRRALMSLATAAALVLAVGFTTSFFSNRGLEKRVVAAAEGTTVLRELSGPVTPEALASLDSLGIVFATLREFEQDGPPLRYRWGLYPGNALLDDTRRVYFTRFQSLLGADAQSALLASLQRAVATRDPADREPTYQGLKSYLMTHDRNDRATESFLPSELLRFWAGGREIDSETAALVTSQFSTYARELPFGDPLSLATDSVMVASTREYLLDAASSDRIYQAVTGSVEAQDVRFANQFGGQRIVTNAHIVPGAYTREGWAEVQTKLSGNLVDDEDWVTDAPPPAPENIEQLRETLKTRYEIDYVRQWQDYLEAGAIGGFGEVTRAFEALEIVADPSSPLLGMIGLASTHTVVDSSIIQAFAPAHHVVPAEGGPVSEVNQPYLQAVNTLASSLRTVAESEGPTRNAASIGANSDARRASQAVAQITVGMDAAPAGESARRHVRRLLETPIERAMGVLGALPADELNGAGGSFCREMNRVTEDYPFDRQSSDDADPEEVGVAFGAGSSTLWNFYDENLKGIISEAGGRFRRAAGASPSPTDDFVRFFDRAARVSRGLFPTEGRNVEILLSIAVPPPNGIDEIVIANNAQRIRFTDRDRASKTMRWTPDPSSTVSIVAVSGGNTIPILEASGTWSLFRIFRDADWASQGGDAYSVTWNDSELNGPLSARVSFAGASDVDILNPDLIGNVSCVGRIVR